MPIRSRRSPAPRALLAAGALALPLALDACGGASASAGAAPTPARPPAYAAIVRTADSLLADPQFANARWGVLIVRPRTGDTLYARDADKLFMPASNQKLLTGATALALLGPDYRWRTTVAARGSVRDGVLRGDLAVVGRGDPTVSDALRQNDAMGPLRAMADSLRARGITRVTGRLVAAGDAFPDAPHGYGWAWDDLDEPYSAGVDELTFNEGYARVVLLAGERPGDSVRVRVAPAPSALPVAVRVQTVTPGIGGGTTPTRVTPRWDAVARRHVLEGVVAAGDSAVLEIAHRDPQGAYLAALGDALRAAGIVVGDSTASVARVDTVRGAARAPTTARPARPSAARRDSAAARDSALALDAPLDTLFHVRSLPLREVLPAFEKPSQNQIGELLLKTMGLERTGVGTADSGRRAVERQLAQWGVDPQRDVAVRDGSGLSRHDYLSPRAIVRVLDAMRRDSTFRVFYDALPVAGVDGTIRNRMKGTPAAGNVRAKTGTLDKARALSGYVTTADGELLLFSILANNYTVPLRQVDRVQDSLAAALAAMRFDGAATGTPSAAPRAVGGAGNRR